MKIELIKNGKSSIGWKIIPEKEEEKLTLGTIRGLCFYGVEGDAIKYDGIKSEPGPNGKDNVTEIRWLQAKHQYKGKYS
jgi:hypothetical protein